MNGKTSTDDLFDFVTEISLFTLLSGALLCTIIISVIEPPSGGWLMLILEFAFMTFRCALSALFGLLLFIFCFRLVIYATLKLPMSSKGKLAFSTLIGAGLIITITFLFLSGNPLTSSSTSHKFIIHAFAYTFPFIFWMIYRNIWQSTLGNLPITESDVLDDLGDL